MEKVVRRVEIDASTKGIEGAVIKLDSLRDAQAGVAGASVKTERASLSMEGALSRLQKQVDPLYRAETQLAAGTRTLDRAFSQGLVDLQRRDDLLSKLRARTLGLAQANDNLAASTKRGSFSGAGSALSQGLTPLTSQIPGAGFASGLSGMSAGAAGIAASVAAIAAAGVAIGKAGDEWTNYTNRLKAAGEDQGVVNRRMDELTAIAMRSRSQLASTVDLYAGINKSTQDLGKSQTDVARVTETIAKAFTIGGQSASTASGAITQLNQAFAAGALRGDELNSVLEGAPPLARLIAKEFGIGVGELKKFGEDGKLSADRVFDAFLKGSKEIDTTFGTAALTISQGSANAGTALTQLGAEMDSVLGISQRMAKGLEGAAGAIMGMVGAVRAFGDGKKLGEIQTLAANIGSYERQLGELSGRNDYASKTDVAALEKRLADDRGAYDRLIGDRLGSMVQKPEQILLNGEGMLTTERAARTLAKGIEDLSKAEKEATRGGMEPLARATAEANDKFNERAKIAAQMRKDGVENARVADFESRSQKLLASEIKNASDAASKKGGAGATKGAEDAFERAVITQQARTRTMQEEVRLAGLAGSELDAMRVRIDLETAAKKRGLDVSAAMAASILREVEARRAASQALAIGKLDADIRFERDQIGRSSGDQQIASRLRSSGLGLDSAQADAIRLNQTLSETKDLLTGAATGFLADMRAGKTAAEALTNQANRLVDKLLEAAMNKAISGLFGSFLGGFGSGLGTTAGSGGLYAKGGAFGFGNVIPFAKGSAFTNSIVNSPTLFPFAKGTGLMGEAGPEAIMPLRRNSSGELGVMSSGNSHGGGAPNLVVNVQNNTPAEVETRQNSDGSLDVVIDQIEGRIAQRASRGRGALHTALVARSSGQALRG